MSTIVKEKLLEQELRLVQGCTLVGKVADDRDDLPRIGSHLGKAISPVEFEGPNFVIYIQVLSPEPPILKQKLGKTAKDVYIGFDNRIMRFLQQRGFLEAEDKLTFLQDYFKGKLLLFKPVLNYDSKNNFYHYNYELLLDEEGNTNETYVPIPSMRKGMTAGMFESYLLDQRPLTLINYNHSYEVPEFIICDGYLYQFPETDILEKYEANDTLYICRKPDLIRRVRLPDNYIYSTKLVHREISFISDSKRLDWLDYIAENGESIKTKTKLEDVAEPINNVVKEGERAKESSPTSSKIHQEFLISEGQFINRLDYFAKIHELVYIEEDLLNLHTSLKTSKFSILGGMSGTGKTQLALLYAEALGIKNDRNLLVIPVSPSFTEPGDLIGYLNPQTGIYMESEVGLISFLLRASQHPSELFIVVFDEMNLGQVEHYFSDFISLMELPSENRVLRLFSEKSYCVQSEYRNGIKIGDNVLFIGTANFDETTKDFSNRMLDRSNLILLEKMNFLEAKRSEEKTIRNAKEYEEQNKNLLGNLLKPITADNFRSWIKEERGLRALTDDELDLLDKIHEEISRFDSQTGVSFRITKSIGHYIDNIPTDEEGNLYISRETAFDYQIKQRILTKIRGHREQIESLIGRYDGEFIRKGVSLLLASENGTRFEKSQLYLEQKAKELMRNGYTL